MGKGLPAPGCELADLFPNLPPAAVMKPAHCVHQYWRWGI